ncbi:MAG: dehypoxanthine futalosine cyclase [Thermodesulfovibrionales bacterium]|nr:dehypoxanthine futalosine cyclase [Thermodesulfovibrionales bacterium]
MQRISKKDALDLLLLSDLIELGQRADEIRKLLHPENIVTFIVDRNINYTNVCINKCAFCAFYRDIDSPDAYLLSKDEIFQKIQETIQLGGTQILLQGGLHPTLEIDYYTDLLRSIKRLFRVNIHGFSPPEIYYISKKHKLSIKKTLELLIDAGLDSIPGGGAEILSDRIRKIISPNKITASEWLEVMEEAHNLGIKTTATMMFGSLEEPEDIIEHLEAIRNLQDKTNGFTAFIPWSFQPGNTKLSSYLDKRSNHSSMSHLNSLKKSFFSHESAVDYLRILSFSRIYLDNIKNIQASWVTQGIKLAQIALRFGANDFGSTMLEENVVKATGVSYRVSKDDIINAIKDSGFLPAQRDTQYNILRFF